MVFANADRARAWFFMQEVLPKQVDKEKFAYCCYCGKEIPRREAVIRGDMIMCQKCAEEHSSTANDKMAQKK